MAKESLSTSKRSSMPDHMCHPMEMKRKAQSEVALSETLGMISQLSLIQTFRPLMRIRISRQRREFGYEGFSYIDREAGESNMEIKVAKTGYFTKKKVLEMGLQAANKIKVGVIGFKLCVIELFLSDLLQQTGQCYCSVRSQGFRR